MKFFEILYALIMGIIEGVTEWLPISSTGHLILAEKLFENNLGKNLSADFLEMFIVVIQLGAILAIVCLFFKKLNPINFKITKEERTEKWLLWAKVLIACLPAGVIGILFNDKIDELFFNPFTVAITLIVYGIIFIVMEMINKKREFRVNTLKELTFKMAFIIGLIQLLSLIPGTSRSGITIIGAMALACNRSVAAEFSFFLAIPVMIGASLIKLLKFPSMTQSELILLLIGCLTAFIVSMIIVKLLMAFIKKHDFKIFGYYRIVLGIIILILGILEFF